MAPPKPSDSFTIQVSKSMLCTKHQLTLPSAVARDLGLTRSDHPLLGISINPQSRYWIAFYQQRGKGGGWRTAKSSAWTKLAHRHPLQVGDTLTFIKQDFGDGRCYVIRSPRLDEYNTALGFDTAKLFSAPNFYSDSSDDETVEVCKQGSSDDSDDSDGSSDSDGSDNSIDPDNAEDEEGYLGFYQQMLDD